MLGFVRTISILNPQNNERKEYEIETLATHPIIILIKGFEYLFLFLLLFCLVVYMESPKCTQNTLRKFAILKFLKHTHTHRKIKSTFQIFCLMNMLIISLKIVTNI